MIAASFALGLLGGAMLILVIWAKVTMSDLRQSQESHNHTGQNRRGPGRDNR